VMATYSSNQKSPGLFLETVPAFLAATTARPIPRKREMTNEERRAADERSRQRLSVLRTSAGGAS
jgi:hypothetical protein